MGNIKCINIKNKEFINLVDEMGEHSMIVELKVSNWQTKTGLDRFPSKDELISFNDNILSQSQVKEPIILNKIEDLINKNGNNDIFISQNASNEKREDVTAISKRLLFNGKMGKFTAQEVLNNIKTNLGLLEGDTKVLESIISYLGKSKSKIRFAYKDELNGAVMKYDASTNAIIIDRNNFSKYTSRYIVESFLHEVVHSVTVHSLLNPEASIANKMFSKYMRESYDYYKNKSSENSRYGFTNVEEFVAEIFTNPSFAQHIKDIDSSEQNKKNSFFSKLITYIRDILGLTPKYDKVINSIIKTSTSSENQITLNSNLYSKKAEDINPFNNTDNIEDKYSNIIDKINEGLNINIKSLKHTSKITRHSNEVKADDIDKYIESLNNTLELINENKDLNKVLAIKTFTKAMNASINTILKRIDSIDYSNHQESKYTYEVYLRYLTTFDAISNLKSLINEIEQNKEYSLLTEKELSEIKDIIDKANNNYNTLNNRFHTIAKGIVYNMINDIKFHPEIETIHYQRLEKEHKESKIIKNKSSWIIEKMAGRDKSIIDKDVSDKSKKLIESTLFDIYASDKLLTSSINISQPLIQIMNQMFFDIDNQRYTDESMKDNEFTTLYNKLVDEKGTTNITELYKNILTTDSNGRHYLKSDYNAKFISDVHMKLTELRVNHSKKKDEILVELNNIRLKKGSSHNDFILKTKELSKLNKTFTTKSKTLIENNTIENSDGKKIASDKWKNNVDNLSPVEKEVLDFFINLTEENNKYLYGSNKLIKYTFGVKFYELPKITKSTTERVWHNKGKGLIKDNIKDLKKIRTDDFGYTQKIESDLKGDVINNLKVHYRGEIDNINQSLDLMTIMRLDYKNANAHNIRRNYEGDFKLLIDIVKNNKFYERRGVNHILRKNNNKYNEIDGSLSHTIDFMNSMVETKLYDILNKPGVKFGKLDANKVVGFVNSANAFLTLSLNIASGTANVVNANAQLFLESFIKGKYIKAKSIKKANKLYTIDLMNSMKDVGRPINRSFTNQIHEMFNTSGLFNLSEADFMKSDIRKRLASTETLQIFQDTGEHWIQSTIVMATLDGIKVMNNNHEFIDKNGSVVKTESEAASLLDSLSLNKDNGLLEIDKNVIYTTHNKLTGLKEGGKSKVDMLLDKMLKNTIGNYKQMDQPELMKHWYGKLFMLFRKYFMSMGQARLRGIEHSRISKDKLTDEHKRYSYALQDYEEGTYTTLVRFAATALRDRKFKLLSKNWNDLSLSEKVNIKKSVTEIIMTTVVLPTLAKFAAAIAADDDNEYLFFLAYQLKRLDTELSAYRNPSEMFKMLRSPIPSVRLIETAISVTEEVLFPVSIELDENKDITFDFTLNNENKDGDNKLIKTINKNNPFYKLLYKNYQDLFKFQNTSFGGGL